MTDQPPNRPTEQAEPDPELTGEMPAAVVSDPPTDVQPVDEAEVPAVPEAPVVPEPPVVPVPPVVPEPLAASPPPPPPPPLDGPGADVGVGVPAPIPRPPVPAEPASTMPPPVGLPGGSDSGGRPEDEPSQAAALAAERPEVAVGAAFAGGLLLALILKRLAR